MTENVTSLEHTVTELPATAPCIRITAGAGSAGQKTWNLRRPVTLIGSRRPSHIVLHDKGVSLAHCVIVNTGTDVLLKDLHTSGGTICNKRPVDLITLKDGDVVKVGATSIQVAIRIPENESDDSGCGMEYVEPTKFPKPVMVRLEHTDTHWCIEDAVALIGRHDKADVLIDHPDLTSRQALLFRFGNSPALFDLTGNDGVTLNGGACPLAVLQPGDRVGVGPCTLSFGGVEPPSAKLVDSAGDEAEKQAAESPFSRLMANVEDDLGEDEPDAPAPAVDRPRTDADGLAALPSSPSDGQRGSPFDPSGSGGGLDQIESELNNLQRNISESWDRLNLWQVRLREDATKLDKQNSDLTARETELDTKDAALRGQLHDLTRYHEQITARERELAQQLAEIQKERDHVTSGQADLVKREGEIARRNDELQRREHVLAQRWARLMAAQCPHCGKAVNPSPSEMNT